MKISKATIPEVALYLRLEDGDYQTEEITSIMAAAKAYITSYTGLTVPELDLLDDIYIAFMVLCQDMYDNRSLAAEGSGSNKVIETILGLHCKNFIGGG